MNETERKVEELACKMAVEEVEYHLSYYTGIVTPDGDRLPKDDKEKRKGLIFRNKLKKKYQKLVKEIGGSLYSFHQYLLQTYKRS